MRKWIAVLAIVCAAYNGYAYLSRLPFIGTWKPNEASFLKDAFQQGITESQKAALLNEMNETRLEITGDNRIRFIKASNMETYSFKSSKTSDSCYELKTAEKGIYLACYDGHQLSLTDKDSGKQDLYEADH